MPRHPAPAASCSADAHCITCGDDGVPMRVVDVDRESGLALCQGEDGARSTVDVQLVEPVTGGDAVLVHAGVALVRLTEVAA
jgi:hydrogenase maturation factor